MGRRSSPRSPSGGPLIGRRGFMRAAAVGAAGGAVFTAPLSFAEASGGAEETKVITGTAEPGAPDWVYVPVDVPAGVREFAVTYSYDRPAPPPGVAGNALDIGVFDENGYALGDQRGFRGWSGGARDAFAINATGATPGYVAGPVGEGRWHIILGPYTVHPDGLHWRVEVTLRYGEPGPPFVPKPAPTRAKGRGRAWYRGDMHLHSQHSDGQRSPADVAAGARSAELDYIVSTEHNTHTAGLEWGYHAGDDLLIIDGEEITTRNGHYLAVGLPPGRWIDWRYRSVDGVIDRFVDEIHRLGALAVAAHPFCPFVGCSWKFGYRGFDAVEVWNGPWTPDDEIAVSMWDGMLLDGARSGRWLPAVGNSDAHREPQVIGLPQNVVQATDLEKRAILGGVRAGRVWIAESAGVELSLSATARDRAAGIGQRLDVRPEDEVTVRLEAGGVDGCVVRFITDQGQVFQSAPLTGTRTVTWTTTPRVSAYVRAEVRRPTDPVLPAMVAMTNPIFLGRSTRDG